MRRTLFTFRLGNTLDMSSFLQLDASAHFIQAALAGRAEG